MAGAEEVGPGQARVEIRRGGPLILAPGLLGGQVRHFTLRASSRKRKAQGVLVAENPVESGKEAARLPAVVQVFKADGIQEAVAFAACCTHEPSEGRLPAPGVNPSYIRCLTRLTLDALSPGVHL